MNKKKKIIIACIAVVLVAALVIVPLVLKKGKTNKTIVVGTKEFTESRVFGHIFQQLIEGNTDYKVELKEGLGGTQVCFEALKAGEIDLYLEYSGTAYGSILGLPTEEGADIFGVVRTQLADKYKIASLDTLGFNNTYCIAMPSAASQAEGVTKLSDLIDHKEEYRLASSFEFLEREDGLKKLKNDYEGIVFATEIPVEGPLKYVSVESDEVDLVVAFATDGMLQKYSMVVLEDDRHSMFPYDAFPMIRQAALDEHPGLEAVLNKMAGTISDADMSYLNYLVDAEQQKPEDVAHNFLVERGLIKK